MNVPEREAGSLRAAAERAARERRGDEAEALLRRALAMAPEFRHARFDLAALLYAQGRAPEALDHIEPLMAADSRHPAHRSLMAAVLARTGDLEPAVELYRGLLAEMPREQRMWISLGHALKTLGRVDEAVEAYRAGIKVLPMLGEAWWSLANLKTFRFTPEDVAAMEAQLARADLPPFERIAIDFALAKAREDMGDAAGAFALYAEGNRLRRASVRHDPEALGDQVRRAEALFAPDFFASRAGGNPARDPIFVVGLPRSGSTLVEQILASHSQVEGTMELPYLPAIAQRLGQYPEALAELGAEARDALAREYLDRAAVHRKTGRPYFIDKLPDNFAHLGLIRLILPNAKIVDVRRHPMACGFACFRQLFANGRGFSYDLGEFGRHYCDYVAMMEMADRAMPGFVHRVIYERLVADLEGEVRALLDYLGLPFEEACLAFHRTRRAVHTPSGEQVRQPIYADALEQWRGFAAWLVPLEDALTPVLPERWAG